MVEITDEEWDKIDVDSEADAKAAFAKDCADPAKRDPKLLHPVEVDTESDGVRTTWIHMRRACNVCGHVECPCCPAGHCDVWPCIHWAIDHECSYDLPAAAVPAGANCKACGEAYPDTNDRTKFGVCGLPIHKCSTVRSCVPGSTASVSST